MGRSLKRASSPELKKMLCPPNGGHTTQEEKITNAIRSLRQTTTGCHCDTAQHLQGDSCLTARVTTRTLDAVLPWPAMSFSLITAFGNRRSMALATFSASEIFRSVLVACPARGLSGTSTWEAAWRSLEVINTLLMHRI